MARPPTIWFTADTHWAHANVISLCGRPYDDIDAMNESLVERWNLHVAPDDHVWHLGDVGMGPLAGFAPYLARLHGRKHLITGNHDEVWPGHRDAWKRQRAWLQHFETIQPFARRRINGQRVLLSHFPYREAGDHTPTERYTEFRFPDTGAWLIHGHVHNEWKVNGRMINVGVDAWDMGPVTLDRIAYIIAKGAE